MDIQARFVLCVLHDDPLVVSQMCTEFPGYEYDDQFSGQGHDDRMAEAFECSDNTVRPTLDVKDRQSIASHRNVAYVLSPRLVPLNALDEAARALRFVSKCLQSGAQAVKCESSGLTHGRKAWLKLAEAPDSASLYWAWVRRPLADGHIVYSCGMHLLGYRDIQVADEDATTALELIDGFAMHTLIDQPGNNLQTGHTFSLTADSPRYRLTDRPCDRYQEDDFFYNPHGYWSLERI